MGQLTCFIEFFGLTGLWSSWQVTCPLILRQPHDTTVKPLYGISIVITFRRGVTTRADL